MTYHDRKSDIHDWEYPEDEWEIGLGPEATGWSAWIAGACFVTAALVAVSWAMLSE